jgi:hypothetical protein
MFLEWYFLHRWHESARAPEAECGFCGSRLSRLRA